MAEVAYPIRGTIPWQIYYVQMLQNLTKNLVKCSFLLPHPMHLFANYQHHREAICIMFSIQKCPVSKQLRIVCLKTLKTISSPAITSFKDVVEQLQHPEDQPKNFSRRTKTYKSVETHNQDPSWI